MSVTLSTLPWKFKCSLLNVFLSWWNYSQCCIAICYNYTHIHEEYILTQWIKTGDTVLRKIYLSLYLKGSKVLFKVLRWEGVEDRTELQYIDPHSYGHKRCVSLVLQGCSTEGLGPSLSGTCSHSSIFSLTGLVSKLTGGPEGSFCRVVAFSTTYLLQLLWSPTNRLLVFTELYNSSIAHSIFGMAYLIVIKRK